MAKKRLLPSVGLASALGLGAVWFGVAGAQTSDTTTPPSTEAPAPDSGEEAPRPDRENCPDKGEQGGGDATNQTVRGRGRIVRL